MPPWPDAATCEALLHELHVPEGVTAHARKVAGLAHSIGLTLRGRGHPVDLGLVEAGALLHDVGRSRTHGLDHAGVGAALLRERGVPEAVCLIVERHTGGGIDAQEARRLGLPVRDYTPETLEERIVCHADNLVDGSRRQKVQEELAHLRSRGLAPVADKIERLHRTLSAMAGQDLDNIP